MRANSTLRTRIHLSVSLISARLLKTSARSVAGTSFNHPNQSTTQAMRTIQVILLILLLGSIATEKDCPNRATECPDNCEGAQCPQFLNAECRVNPCHGLCTPNFFRENGRNVTDHCDVQNCNQLKCGKGFVCLEMEGGPMCTINKLNSCEKADCPEVTVCSEFNIPSRNITIAQCLPQATADGLPVFGSNFSCSSGFPICDEETEVCSDVLEEDRLLTVICIMANCTASDSTSCPRNRMCTDIPPHFIETLQVPFTKSCTPPSFVYNKTCATAGNPCPAGLECRDVIVKETIIGTACGPPALSYVGSSCAELGCPAPLECYESIIEGRGGLAQCTTKIGTDIIAKNVQRSNSFIQVRLN